MQLSNEIVYEILKYLDFQDYFTSYDDGKNESIRDLWNLRGVSTHFRDCVEGLFRTQHVKDLIFHQFIWKSKHAGETRLIGKSKPEYNIRIAEATFEFTRWTESSDTVIFKFKTGLRDNYDDSDNTEGLGSVLSSGGRRNRREGVHRTVADIITSALEERQKWEGIPGHYPKYDISGIFHLKGDYLAQGMASIPDIISWDLERGEFSFNWVTLFAKHFRNRNAMSAWKAQRNIDFHGTLPAFITEPSHCRDLKCAYIPIGSRQHLTMQASAYDTYGIDIECLQCLLDPTNTDVCLEKYYHFNLDQAARRHVCRLQMKELWKHDRIAVDALTWLDTARVGSPPIVTKNLSLKDRGRCRALAFQLARDEPDTWSDSELDFSPYAEHLNTILAQRQESYWKPKSSSGSTESLSNPDFMWPELKDGKITEICGVSRWPRYIKYRVSPWFF